MADTRSFDSTHHMRTGSNATPLGVDARSSSNGTLLHAGFDRHARSAPTAIALVVEGDRVTYGELDARANRLAHHLRHLGVGRGDRVGLCAARDVNIYVALLGILKTGASYVPLDPALPFERSKFMIQDSGCCAVVTAGVNVAGLTERSVDLLRDAKVIASQPAVSPETAVTPDSEAYVIYTSGTTGTPKGVPIRHQQVAGRIATMSEIYAIEPADRILQFASLVYDASIEQIFTALSSGATLVARPESWNLGSLLVLLEEERVTIADFTPTVWETLSLHLVDSAEPLPSALTRLILGGERLDPAKVAMWFEHYDVPLFNAYGPTEATITATVHRIDRPEEPIVIGVPVSGVHAHVMDESGAPVAAGESGELWLGGTGTADGYLGRPEQTAARFVTGPDGDLVYRTGDKVRWTDEGTLEFLGRLDDQVKIGGVRIEPDEVAVTLASHPDISQSHVEARTIQGQDSLVAYVVPLDYRQIPSVRQMRSYLSGMLPAALVPSYYTILEELPLLASGKLDRAALSEIEVGPRQLDGEHIAPAPGRETRLATLWAQELGVERVGAEDDLMSLGAHSLRIVRIAVQIAQSEGVELSVGELLGAPTVRAQAALVDQRQDRPRRFPPVLPGGGSRAPMSMQQKQVWFLANLDPADMSYRFQAVIRIAGPLELDVVDRVLTELHRRHPILRTTFSEDEKGCWQDIHPPQTVAARRVDLRDVPDAERRDAAEKHIQEAIAAPLDLSRLPLQTWTVIRTDDEQFELVLLESHMVHDGWSLALIMREFSALYDGYISGKPEPLAEPVLGYGDYAAWQERELGLGGALTAQLDSWRERLANPPDPVSIFPDSARPATVGHEGGIVRVDLPGSLPDRIRGFCREHRVTLFELMSSAFYVFLYQHTRQTDLCIGSAFANRRLPGTHDVVGMFVNTVLMRASVRPEQTFEDLLSQVHRDLNNAAEIQEVPFPEIVRALNPERSTATNPFAQVMFSAHDSAFPELNLGAASGTISYPSNNSAKFDLSVIVLPAGEAYSGLREVADQRITVDWEYNSTLFAESTVERMAARYVEVLERLLAEPTQTFSRLSMIGDAERRELAVLGRGPALWRDASANPFPDPVRVVDYIGAWAHESPSTVAVRDDAGELTYQELDDIVDGVAALLLARGLRAQSVVGVFVERGRDLPIAAAAAHRARMAYAPIDPAEPAERLAMMLDGVDVVLCSESTIDRVPQDMVEVLTVTEACHLAHDVTRSLPSDGAGDDLAYIIHTSGSTGAPKGVMIEQASLADHIRWSNTELPLPHGALVPCTASQSFDVSVWEMWRGFAAGATCLMTSHRMAPDELVRWLREHRVTHCYLPTPLAIHVLSHHRDELPDLVWLGAGGDRLELPVGTRLPFALTNLYGPAEATIWATTLTIPAGSVIGEGLAVPPIGRPIAGAEVVVVDELGRELPIGVAGELLIGGHGVSRGYHRSPERTSERFVTRAGFDGQAARYYRTGDLVRWNADGELEFLGRLDRQVKIRGYRIELGEIEAALRAKTDVMDCAVVARRHDEHPSPASTDMALVAFVVGPPGRVLDVHSLRAALKDRLPDYMVPAVFVSVDQIPLTVNGKVDVAALPVGTRQRLAPSSAEVVQPRDELERTIAAIWIDALGTDAVGVHDNFFDLGGHSLMVTQLINRVERRTGIRLSVREVYEAPTVAAMKTALVERVAAEAPQAALSTTQPGS